MKKIVNIEYETKDGNEYFVLKVNDLTIYVDKKKKTIDGKELFNKIYFDLSASNFFEVEVNCSSLNDEDKKVFGFYVIKLFSLVDAEMKKQFPNAAGSDDVDVKDEDNGQE